MKKWTIVCSFASFGDPRTARIERKEQLDLPNPSQMRKAKPPSCVLYTLSGWFLFVASLECLVTSRAPRTPKRHRHQTILTDDSKEPVLISRI